MIKFILFKYLSLKFPLQGAEGALLYLAAPIFASMLKVA